MENSQVETALKLQSQYLSEQLRGVLLENAALKAQLDITQKQLADATKAPEDK